MLHSAEKLFQSNKVLTIWLTANQDESLVGSLLQELRELRPLGHQAKKILSEIIKNATFSGGTAGTGVRGKLNPGATSAGSKVVRKALTETTKAIIGQEFAGIAIFVDEIQSADEVSLRAIAHAWQEPGRYPDAPPIGFFGAGLPGSQDYITETVTFSERFDFRTLPLLPEGGVLAALVDPPSDLGVTWDADALAEAVELSEQYPYKVQLVGDEIWRAAGFPARVSRLTLKDLTLARPEVERQMRVLFSARWRSASPKQQQLMIAMAEFGGSDVKRDAIAKFLSVSTNSLSVPRDRLIRNGLIAATDHGHLSLTVPGFADFVQNTASQSVALSRTVKKLAFTLDHRHGRRRRRSHRNAPRAAGLKQGVPAASRCVMLHNSKIV